ncbi:MAG: phosphomethylpyrimidine synthase ThiC [Candidatus Omnitrophica bacterium]|nr:phosphomethylpyrimidine synthase ThiC [Candidatus Omnitrophota bacterium]
MIRVNDDVLRKAAAKEDASLEHIKAGLAAGTIVIPANNRRSMDKPCAVGKGLKTKVNANIGVSHGYSDIDAEIRKMEAAVDAGADALMDLSTGPLVKKLREKIMSLCPIPVGTVPIYEIADEPEGAFLSRGEEDFLDVLRQQAEAGVDFFTIHAGISLDIARRAAENRRVMNIVSRGGALLASWMLSGDRENPFLSRYDDVLDILKEYDITISLGDSLRPGSVCDATDDLQISELVLLGELQRRAFEKDVQVIIEGPGHVPLDQIEANVKLEKSLCHGAPFYVLGPLVTDAAPGYDHIVSAIGGAIAASAGADFLCYVTPAEHLRLPGEDDVRSGVIASKIAAHAADIVKGVPSAIQLDRKISEARAARDWKRQFALALDPRLPEKVRKSQEPDKEDVCTMCSEYCSIKIMEDCVKARQALNESGSK